MLDEAVDRINRVALLAEGVDRNGQALQIRQLDFAGSPSSRRAWIEIPRSCERRSVRWVALLAEGVDRNGTAPINLAEDPCRPPRGGRG